MKCSSIKLINKKDYKKIVRNNKKEDAPAFTGEESHSYSFSFIQITTNNSKLNPKQKPKLAVTNLMLPENIPSFNTGSSLERWSSKRPRLKSSTKIKKNDNSKITQQTTTYNDDYDTEIDLSLILNELDEGFVDENNELINDDSSTTTNLEYQIHSDIEELIRRTEQSSNNQNNEELKKDKSKHRRKKHNNNNKKDKTQIEQKDNKTKKKIKHKLKKIIKFSISKPPSPQTEQVIRVDVTSNMSVEDYQYIESCNDQCKDHEKMINDNRKELKENLNETDDDGRVENNDGEDEDFIVRCKQLALRQRRI